MLKKRAENLEKIDGKDYIEGVVPKRGSRKVKKIYMVTAIVMSVLIVVVSVVCGVLFTQEKYEIDFAAVVNDGNIVWSDEFDGDALAASNWTVEAGLRRGGYWAEEQAIVSDGVLKIRTEKIDGKYYMSGLISKDKMEYKYGYIEASIRLPKAQGIWSAFWTMPHNAFADVKDASINGAEIDIMEAPCYPNPYVQQAVHIGGYGKLHRSTFWPGWVSYDCGDIYDSFHTYGLYWDENIYKFYIDGNCIWTTSYNKNVSKVMQYLYLSVETGSAFDDNDNPILGVPGPNPWSFVGGKNIWDYDELLPADFEIDYVRLYKIDSTVVKVGGDVVVGKN